MKCWQNCLNLTLISVAGGTYGSLNLTQKRPPPRATPLGNAMSKKVLKFSNRSTTPNCLPFFAALPNQRHVFMHLKMVWIMDQYICTLVLVTVFTYLPHWIRSVECWMAVVISSALVVGLYYWNQYYGIILRRRHFPFLLWVQLLIRTAGCIYRSRTWLRDNSERPEVIIFLLIL